MPLVTDTIEFTGAAGTDAYISGSHSSDLTIWSLGDLVLQCNAEGSSATATIDFKPNHTLTASIDNDSLRPNRITFDTLKANPGAPARLTCAPGSHLNILSSVTGTTTISVRANRDVRLTLRGRNDRTTELQMIAGESLALSMNVTGGVTFHRQAIFNAVLDCTKAGFATRSGTGAPVGAGQSGQLYVDLTSGAKKLYCYSGAWRSISLA